MTLNKINSIAFALDPTNTPSFLLDWELTLKCNLDCKYCPTDIESGGHNNDTDHPPIEECLRTIDFMYKYADIYMQYKKPSQRKVVLNVYGGESLFHPDIVEILEACRQKHEQYKDSWYLTITCTTNGIVGQNQWKRIVPFIDEFTVSYHADILPKQRQQYKDNVEYLKEQNKRFKCVIMMHNNKDLWPLSEEMVNWCADRGMRYFAKPFDSGFPEWEYTTEQFSKMKTIWLAQANNYSRPAYQEKMDNIGKGETVKSFLEGRACCGGRRLSLNGDLKSSVSFVPRQGFEGWSCSVNWFFLYVQQVTGKVYTNKDCRINPGSNQVEPLGTLGNYQEILNSLKEQLDSKTMPVIQCIKPRCACGFCAPKAESRDEFNSIVRRYVIEDVFLK